MESSTRTRRFVTRSRMQLQGRTDRMPWDPRPKGTKFSPATPGPNRPDSPIARAYLLFLMQRLGKGSFLDRLRGVAELNPKQLQDVEPDWKAWLAALKRQSA